MGVESVVGRRAGRERLAVMGALASEHRRLGGTGGRGTGGAGMGAWRSDVRGTGGAPDKAAVRHRGPSRCTERSDVPVFESGSGCGVAAHWAGGIRLPERPGAGPESPQSVRGRHVAPTNFINRVCTEGMYIALLCVV